MILPGLLARLNTPPLLVSRVLSPPLARVVLGVEGLRLAGQPQTQVMVGFWEAEPEEPEPDEGGPVVMDEPEVWTDAPMWPTSDQAPVGGPERPARGSATVAAPMRPPAPERRLQAPPAPPTPASTLMSDLHLETDGEPSPTETPALPQETHPQESLQRSPPLATPQDRDERVLQDGDAAKPATLARGPLPLEPPLAGRTIHEEQVQARPDHSARSQPESALQRASPGQEAESPASPLPDLPVHETSSDEVSHSAAPHRPPKFDDLPLSDIQSPPSKTAIAAPSAAITAPPSTTSPDPGSAPSAQPNLSAAPAALAPFNSATPEPRRPRPEVVRPQPPAPEPPKLFEAAQGDRSPASWLARLRMVDAENAEQTPATEEPPPTLPQAAWPNTHGEPDSGRTHLSAGRPATPGPVAAQSSRPAQAQPRAEHPRVSPSRHSPALPPITVQAIASSARPWLEPIIGYDPTGTPVITGSGATQVAAQLRADAFAVQGVVVLAGAPDLRAPTTAGLLAHELTHLRPERRTSSAPEAPATAEEETLARSAEAQAMAPAARSLQSPVVAPRPDPWGDLPAPWEPLPDWLTAPQAAGSLLPTAPTAPTAPAALPTQPMQAAARTPTPSVAPPPALAATDRPAAAPAALTDSAQPAPDLDALARQVYGVLKRRLALERRRGTSEGSP